MKAILLWQLVVTSLTHGWFLDAPGKKVQKKANDLAVRAAGKLAIMSKSWVPDPPGLASLGP
jgi:hypothetical protein